MGWGSTQNRASENAGVADDLREPRLLGRVRKWGQPETTTRAGLLELECTHTPPHQITGTGGHSSFRHKLWSQTARYELPFTSCVTLGKQTSLTSLCLSLSINKMKIIIALPAYGYED